MNHTVYYVLNIDLKKIISDDEQKTKKCSKSERNRFFGENRTGIDQTNILNPIQITGIRLASVNPENV